MFVALVCALRDECRDLEAAGIRIVQVDEPALRETLPLRRAAQQAYLDWAVGAFRIATSGVADATQIAAVPATGRDPSRRATAPMATAHAIPVASVAKVRVGVASDHGVAQA